MTKAIILFAHGARDPDWARPFEHLRDEVAARTPGVRVVVAFLEFMQPPLADAIDALIADKVCEIDIVPAFMAQGAHLKRDLPRLLEAARAKHPDVRLVLRPALGEAPGVIAAMARHIAENRA
jgi:sirohydrochlorin cobaltochelatase